MGACPALREAHLKISNKRINFPQMDTNGIWINYPDLRMKQCGEYRITWIHKTFHSDQKQILTYFFLFF